MTLRTIRDNLEREAGLGRHDRAFAAAGGRHPVLAAHGSVLAVLKILGLPPDEERRRVHDDLLRALLAEHHAGRGTFWSSVLVYSFYPMLSRLRSQVHSSAAKGEDLDQMVLTCFLEVIGAYRPRPAEGWLSARIRKLTRRLAFRGVLAEQRQRDLARAAVHSPWLGKGARSTSPFDAIEKPSERTPEDVLAWLLRAEDLLPDDPKVAVLLATTLGGLSLREYAAQLAGEGASADHSRRVYDRCKQHRARLITRLRAELA